ncbi:MAG: hypothetical protein V1644_03340 [Candidatus Micrarchaeota archaeon]
MQIQWQNAGFSSEQIRKVCDGALMQRLNELRSASRDFTYSKPEAGIALCFDKRFINESTKLAAKFKSVELVVVIGIGGSNLGCQAVCEAVLGSNYNLFSKKKLLWLDAINSDSLLTVKKAMSQTRPKKTLLIVISKSGNNTEPIANFQIVYKKGTSVVVISENNSKLHGLAIANDFHFLHVPKKLSGRYSVFSNVGLFPLAVMGVDVKKLLAGAAAGAVDAFSPNAEKNPVAVLAALLYLHCKKRKRCISENLFFANNLEHVGKWYRQLLAESIGKEKNLVGKIVNEGITPVVATAVDLHSQAQLYFGGPDNRFYSVTTVQQQKSFAIPVLKGAREVVSVIQGKGTSQVSRAIEIGFKKSLVNHCRPFVEFNLREINEEELGYYMQVQMIAVMLLAHLLNVNPFDQPNVEDYKIETKRQLS